MSVRALTTFFLIWLVALSFAAELVGRVGWMLTSQYCQSLLRLVG